MHSATSAAPDTSQLPVLPTLSRVDRDLLDKARMAVVVDTNYLIDDLPLIQALSRLAYREQLVIVLPSVVLQELDRLKRCDRTAHRPGRASESIGPLARGATRFLDNELGRNDSALRCQKVSEYVHREQINDDKILDCCLYIIEHRRLPVAILTRDRNLAVKARANGCATCGEWANGAAGLLTAILNSGGLELQAQLPVDAAPLSMPVTRSLEAHSTAAEQSSAESSSDPQSPKRPALAPKKAGKSKVDATQPLSQAQRRASSGNKNGILRPSIKGSGTQVSKAVGRVPPATTAAHALLPHLATTAHASLPGLPVFGRTSSRFTFTAPSYISLSDLATPPPQSQSQPQPQQPQQPQATIVISDSVNDDMDIDMLDDSEIQIIEAMAPSSGYTPVVSPVAQFSPTLATPTQCTPPLTAPATPPAPPRPADIISPATNSQLPKPIVIYLDDSPESNKQAGRSYTVSKSAVEISKDVTTYIYNTLSCGFTRLLSERLEKGLTSSYAGNWITTLGEMFDPPPWRSATVMLTVLLYYWDPIFSLVFPRSFGASIRDVIPWVMRVECLTECPQTRKELPQRLRFAPFAYLSEASAANPADSALDKELTQDAESRAETVKLIHLAKRLLAQSALVESDAQERRRLQLFDDWVAWQKTHG